LHPIAAASVAGLLFLRLPAAATLAASALALAAPQFLRTGVLDAPWLAWLGLTTYGIRSVDFEPFLPWVAPLLAGIAAAKIAAGTGVLAALGRHPPPGAIARALGWAGRHSLAVYLVHQPVLIALVWAFTRIAGRGDPSAEVHRPVARGILHPRRQTDPVQKADEGPGVEVLDIGHLFHVPDALRDQDRGGNRRDACGIGNALRPHFLIGFPVVGDVVDEDLGRPSVLGPLDEVADAGLAGVVGGETGRIGQHRFHDLERHHLLSLGRPDRLFGEQAEILQDGEDIDVVIAEAHPETYVCLRVAGGKRMHLVMAGEIGLLLSDHRKVPLAAHLEHAVRLPGAVLP